MNKDPEGPADTRMMGVVHSALRRDLVRTRMVLEGAPSPGPRRRVALADHVGWLMDFLHAHHRGEDDGLYPLVMAKNPQAAAMVAEMDAEHALISPAIRALEEAAAAYRADPADSGEHLLAALATMAAVLLPHLEREEVEMMPIVAASITVRDWEHFDQETNVKHKGLMALGMEGHWLIDGTDAESRSCVVGLVPPIPRFVLLHGFAGPYRRRRTALWGGTEADRVPSLSLALAGRWTP
jgi:hemerythrin-like domain-containing protein